MDVAWPRIDIRGVTGGAEWQVCVSQRHLDRYVGRDAFSCQCPFKDAPLLGYVMRPRLHGREWSLTVPRSEQKDRGETQGGQKWQKEGQMRDKTGSKTSVCQQHNTPSLAAPLFCSSPHYTQTQYNSQATMNSSLQSHIAVAVTKTRPAQPKCTWFFWTVQCALQCENNP